MIIGYSVYSGTSFDTVIGHNKIHTLKIKNASFDEVKIDEVINPYSIEKEQWNYSTTFLAPFKGNLNAGNVDFIGMTVSKLRIKRRKSEEFDWQVLGEWEFDITKQDYELYDNQVESYQPYEYLVVPVVSGDVEGNLINIKEITPEYYGTFIADKNNNIPLIYNVEYSGVTRNQKSEIIEPINSKYPIIVDNASLDYMKGSISAVVIAGETDGNFDIRQERLHRKKVMDFLCDKKPKLLKNGNGELWLIKVTGSPKIEYFNNVGQVCAKIEFDWVEIGDAQNLNEIRVHGLI